MQRRSRHGFTMMEIAIVVAMIAIMTAIGVGYMNNGVPRQRARSAAMEFQSHVNLCRNMAVRTGNECRILLVTYDSFPSDISTANAGEYWIQLGDKSSNSSTWDTLPYDSEDDGTDDETWEGIVDISASGTKYRRYVSIEQWDTLGGPGAGNSDAIVFDGRGFVRNPNSDFEEHGGGYLEVAFINKKDYAEGVSDRWVVQIGRTGFVRLENDLGLDKGDNNFGHHGSSG